MAARSLTERVEILEQKVEALQALPDRVTGLESQILQLRGEIREGFSATRVEIEETRRHARTMHGEVLTALQETQGQMRMLHEDVISRIALLQESPPQARPRQDGRGRRKR